MNNDKTLRVLQICNHYEAPFLDVTRQYATLFQGKQVKIVTVFLRGASSSAAERVLEGGKVVFLNLSKSQVRGLKRKAINDIRELHRQYDFQLCISHRYHPTKIATQVGSFPVLSVHHRFGTYSRWERRFYINRKQQRLTLLNVSNAVRDETRSFLPRWPETHIRTFYNHVDVDALTNKLQPRAQARLALGLPQDAFVIANVGRLHKDKDQKTLLDAFAKALPSLPSGSLLVIYGKGPLQSQLKQQAQQLGIERQVVFAGFVDMIADLFAAFDIFALTSDHEPFGMVLLEAMVAGVPVICSHCGGGPEVVGDTGLLFPLGNSDQLAARLLSLASHSPAELALMQQAQLERVQQYFSDAHASLAFEQELTRLGLELTSC